MRIKIIGAGSIGNHLAHASRSLGWQVDMTDIDISALDRTKNEIYPSRYGVFDEEINLYSPEDVPKNCYDIIFIGTPPDSHIQLAIEALSENPKVILVEKPLCDPSLSLAEKLLKESAKKGVKVYVGYDHVVGKSTKEIDRILENNELGQILTLDVEFREFWGGIFAAHPWLDGPSDTYLGFWNRGGGSSSEHSHAANLWQHFSHQIGSGRITEVSACLDFVKNDLVDYDQLCLMNFKTESGLYGRCVQDVVTQPVKKCARIQGESGFIEWDLGFKPGSDRVHGSTISNQNFDLVINKSRPDDFIEELLHIESNMGCSVESPISLERGLETALVIAAAIKSSKESRTIKIDYSKGFNLSALI